MCQYTCIVCPNSCLISVEEKNGQLSVSGNQCPRGEAFAIQEHTKPMRMFTSTVRIEGALNPRISVISETEIPKEKLAQCQEQLSKITLSAPVFCGEKICTDIGGTGVDMVASRTMERKDSHEGRVLKKTEVETPEIRKAV